MMTLRDISNDVLVSLRQINDDKRIQPAHVVYWILVLGNKLKSQHIAKRSSGLFLTTFSNVPVKSVAASTQNEIAGRKFFVLPRNIYDYHMDKGIEYISYVSPGGVGCPPRYTRHTFTRTTVKESEWLYMSKETQPSPKQPFFHVSGDHVYLLGIEKVPVKELEMGLYITFDPITTIDIDAAFDFPEELISQLKREVLDLGRFLLMVPQERLNDGNNTITPNQVPTQKLVSVAQQPDDQQ